MKNRFFLSFWCFAVLGSSCILCSKQNETQETPKQNSIDVHPVDRQHVPDQEKKHRSESQPYDIVKIRSDTSLEPQLSRQTYSPFNDETVENEEGYGVYYEKATVELSQHGKVLTIKYGLPSYFSWGNWLSIRREFESVLDMSDCSGLEFDLKILKPSRASLRLTLCDVQAPEDINKHGADEMWWFDLPELNSQSTNWTRIRAPFQEFRPAWGTGTRHNDSKLDATKIVALEISLVSKAKEHPEGIIIVKSFRTY